MKSFISIVEGFLMFIRIFIFGIRKLYKVFEFRLRVLRIMLDCVGILIILVVDGDLVMI